MDSDYVVACSRCKERIDEPYIQNVAYMTNMETVCIKCAEKEKKEKEENDKARTK